MDLTGFAEAVGTDGPVTCVGGRTQWGVGGLPSPAAREVHAPAGIDSIVAEEMTVCCGAGTLVRELLAALAEEGQTVALPAWQGATVGGVLAVGRSGVERLGRGPVRDTLLQARVVTSAGKIVKAGGPTVKNVSGYDLCRLLVGSLGVLAFLAEVILRTMPLPETSQWFAGAADPFELRRRLYRPTSLLWDGRTTWVLLEGRERDVAGQAAIAGLGPAQGPPVLPRGGRWSLPPAELHTLEGHFVAEVGVGVVHHERGRPTGVVPAPIRALNQAVKDRFDPNGRMNPGRTLFGPS